MKRYFGIFSLLVVLAAYLGMGDRAPLSCDAGEAVVSLHNTPGGDSKDRLFDVTPTPQKHEATLNDRADTFHASSGRVRRVLPSTGFRPGNMAARAAANYSLAAVFTARVGQSRLSTLPQRCLTVRYYVIALRHILR